MARTNGYVHALIYCPGNPKACQPHPAIFVLNKQIARYKVTVAEGFHSTREEIGYLVQFCTKFLDDRTSGPRSRSVCLSNFSRYTSSFFFSNGSSGTSKRESTDVNIKGKIRRLARSSLNSALPVDDVVYASYGGIEGKRTRLHDKRYDIRSALCLGLILTRRGLFVRPFCGVFYLRVSIGSEFGERCGQNGGGNRLFPFGDD